jgi:hypothetical protein
MNSTRYLFLVFALVLLGACNLDKTEEKVLVDKNDYLVQIKDSLFNEPYIDVDEWRDEPVRHRYVHGGFKGRDTRFSFYFPPKEKYDGRFFQYITPVPDNENLSQGAHGEENKIGFSIESGAYFIETNGGGADGNPMGGGDKMLGAYGANAICAIYSRELAAEMYGEHRPYGYAFGGSGGAYRTIGGFENTNGVWDGVVPFVVGSPMAIPNVFTVRMHAMRVLKDKFPQIVDAIEPGGSGNMYEGLNLEEREALAEVTKMGFPPKAWFNHKDMGIHAFPAIYGGMRAADKSYFEDFWTKPGYLGYNPTQSLLEDRLQHHTTIKKIITAKDAYEMGLDIGELPGTAHGTADAAWQALDEKEQGMPVAFQLEQAPRKVQFLGGELVMKSGGAEGKEFAVRSIRDDIVILGQIASKTKLARVVVGDEVVVDNSNYLAAQTYHRHQVPGPEYKVWDQFRDFDGTPIYPQRKMIIGPIFSAAAAGALPNGKFKGKMILLENLWDTEAYPWQAEWYRDQVIENLGDQTDNHFVLWFTDHANHGDFAIPGEPTHIVSYLGVLQQALRDLSAWVEKGFTPPSSTNYQVIDGQVVVPESANDRKGIQPTLSVMANDTSVTHVKVGEEVDFCVAIQVPASTGKIVSVEWDFEGEGNFPLKEELKTPLKEELKIQRTYQFLKPGTYFPTVRVASQRDGNTGSPFARIQNLDRVRVVVEE